MTNFKALVGVLVLAPLVSAFYPYVPEYRCLEDGDCLHTTSKRSTSFNRIRSATLDEVLTLELRKRTPEIDLPHDVYLSKVVERLTSKYQNRASHQVASNAVGRRANTYNVVVANTPTMANSAGLNQDGTDFSYFATVKLGSAGKPLYMLLDTGADSTWVMSSACASSACAKHSTFGASDSTTYQATTTTFSITYGSGAVTGTLATDTLSIAGLKINSTFGAAGSTSDDFLSFPFDGILGLARSTTNTMGESFIDSLVGSKQLKSNIFGININRNSDGLKDGEITFGASDTSKYTGSLTYTAVSGTSGNWIIPVDDIGINNKKSGVTGKTAYIDTGTSYSFIPPADLAPLFANIPGSSLSSDGGTYYVPCDTTSPLQFYFSGVAYNVLAKDWVGGKVGDVCTSNVYAKAIVGTSWLLGDIFLKNVYAVFDADQNRIGFAAKPSSASAAATSSSPSSASKSSSASAASSSTTAVAAAATASPTSTAPPASSTVSSLQTSSSSNSPSVASSASRATSTSKSGSSPSTSSGSSATSTVSSISSVMTATGGSTAMSSSVAPFINAATTVPSSGSAQSSSSAVNSPNIAASALSSSISSASRYDTHLVFVLTIACLFLAT